MFGEDNEYDALDEINYNEDVDYFHVHEDVGNRLQDEAEFNPDDYIEDVGWVDRALYRDLNRPFDVFEELS